MSGDVMHAKIEKICKNKSIFVTAQWCEYMQKATKKPYTVRQLIQAEIYNFDSLAEELDWKRIKQTKLREILFVQGEIFVKYDYNDIPVSVDINKWNFSIETWDMKRAYRKKINLDAEKKKDLKEMCDKGLIPKTFHSFYEKIIK